MRKIPTVKIPSAAVAVVSADSLPPIPPKSHPDYYKIIGIHSAAKRKMTKEQMSEMAKRSHGPNSKRDGYHGGRKKKNGTTVA